MEDFKIVVLENYEFENHDLLFYTTFLAFPECRDWEAQNDFWFFQENFVIGKKLLIETFGEGVKHEVLKIMSLKVVWDVAFFSTFAISKCEDCDGGEKLFDLF